MLFKSIDKITFTIPFCSDIEKKKKVLPLDQEQKKKNNNPS